MIRRVLIVFAAFVLGMAALAAVASGAATVLHLAAGETQQVDCPNKISVEPIDPSSVTVNCAADSTTTTVAPTTTTLPPTTTTVAPTTTTVLPTTTTLPKQADAIIVNVDFPATISPGDHVVFSATVKNQGDGATPAGTIVDVLFSVDDGSAPNTTWSDNNSTSLAAGDQRVQQANGSPDAGRNYWLATPGMHTLDAYVNSNDRFPESTRANNHLTTPFTVAVATTTTTLPPTTTTQPSNRVNVKSAPYNAACNGTTNDTAAVQAAANASVGKTLYFPAGTCMVNTVNVPAGVNVTGDGPTSLVKQRTLSSFNDPSPVFDAGGTNVFTNLKIDGSRVANRPDRWSDSYNDAGRGFKNSSTCCGRGRGYRSGIRGESISGLTVDHVELTNIAGAAVATNMASNVTLSNSYVHDSDFEALYAFGDGNPVADVSGSNINMVGNTITNIRSPSAAGATNPNGIVISRATSGSVIGNTFTNTDRDSVKLEADQNFTVSGNTGSAGTVGIDYPVIALQPYHDHHNLGSRHIRITDNHWSGPGHQAGVQINSSDTTTLAAQDIEVDHNTLGGSLVYGVLMDGRVGLNQINVHDNTITGTSTAAIYVNGGGSNLAMNTNTHSGTAVANVNIPGSFLQSQFYN